MTEPTFDINGYPTDDTLRAIEDWIYTDTQECLRFIQKAWHWPDWCKEKSGMFVFATGGWSGNESLMNALHQNMTMCAINFCRVYHFGGFEVWAISDEARETLRDFSQTFTDSCWSYVGDKKK